MTLIMTHAQHEPGSPTQKLSYLFHSKTKSTCNTQATYILDNNIIPATESEEDN
jgi:hypothetical protein